MYHGNAPKSLNQTADNFEIFMSKIELLLNDITLRCFLMIICHNKKRWDLDIAVSEGIKNDTLNTSNNCKKK